VIPTRLPEKKIMVSAVVVILFIAVLFNIEHITGSAVNVQHSTISLSSDGENFIDNARGNTLSINAGDLIYVKLTPADNNNRVFVYDPRSSSKASTFETKCLEKKDQGSKCLSSLAVYKTPADKWMNGVYTVKIAGVSGKAEFALQNSKFGG
jgi:uncharacterized protein (UPF0333 family)